MKKYLCSLLLVLILFFGSVLVSQKVFAASLKFDQSSINVSAGNTFQVQVIVDAGADQITGTDAWIIFDSSILQAQSVAAGSFFPEVSNNITPGKIYIAGIVSDPATSKTGSGTVATITFSALVSGSTTLAYECQATGETSKVIKNDFNSTNIIVCSNNGSATVSVGAGSSSSSPTATPAPASSGSSSTSSTTTTPSTLPQSGILDNLLGAALPGAGLLLVGIVLKLLL